MTLAPHIARQLDEEAAGRAARRRTIAEVPLGSRQGPRVVLPDGRDVLNLCSNDYLGLAGDPLLHATVVAAQERWGLGAAAGRIISGTFAPHVALEAELSAFLGTPASMLFTSCFDANAGLFEALAGPEDLILSDAHNHASIIDGIRLSRARRATYPSRDLPELRRLLEDAGDARRILIVTDGVFSMDGEVADLPRLCDLADRFDALLIVDDSHGVGVLGPLGQGAISGCGVEGRVDLITGTFGKALGGLGGFISGRSELIAALRQTSRPYLFSNALPPAYAEGARYVLRMLQRDEAPLTRLRENVALLREELRRCGAEVADGQHPIIPIILGDEEVARATASRLRDEGMLVVPLTHPVVARGQARLRLQVSAAHDPDDLRWAARVIGDAVRRAAVGRVADLGRAR